LAFTEKVTNVAFKGHSCPLKVFVLKQVLILFETAF
jgi:hypothetical protein